MIGHSCECMYYVRTYSVNSVDCYVNEYCTKYGKSETATLLWIRSPFSYINAGSQYHEINVSFTLRKIRINVSFTLRQIRINVSFTLRQIRINVSFTLRQISIDSNLSESK